MFDDGRRVPDGGCVEAQVCIIGAGPAGLSVARELDSAGISVCLIEAGGLQADSASAALHDVQADPDIDLYPNLQHLRDIGFGGTARQWCIDIGQQIWVRLAQLNPIDFRQRAWLAHSGWPIDEKILAPYLRRALRAMGCEAPDFDIAPWLSGEYPGFDIADTSLEHRLFLFSPQAAFLEEARELVERSRRIRCLLNSSAVALDTGPDARAVSAVQVRCLSGTGFLVRARLVVMAQGGFEVPRLLLASNSVVHNGLGNTHDLVGRFLMDHQIIDAGVLRAPRGGLPGQARSYDMREHAGVHGLLKFGLDARTLETERILSSVAVMLPHDRLSWRRRLQRPFGRPVSWRSPARLALRELREQGAGAGALRTLARLSRVATGLDDVLYHRTRYHRLFRPAFTIDHGGWSKLPDIHRRFDGLDVFLLCEQAPDPQNRIMLGEERDPLGMRKSRVRMRWNEIDARSAARSQELIARSLRDAGVGTLRYRRRNGEPLVTQISTHHPAGTTRMSALPEQGVVDSNCRVHGIDNLFVASSSVFPTGGYANPTLTIVALAIRIADSLLEMLRRV